MDEATIAGLRERVHSDLLPPGRIPFDRLGPVQYIIHMDENSLSGNLSGTPFAEVICRIWQRERSGYLILQTEAGSKTLSFERGRAALDNDSFPAKQFLRFLSDEGRLDDERSAECENYAAAHSLSLPKALMALNLIGPSEVWRRMADYLRNEILPLFDRPAGGFAFHAARPAPELRILLTLPLPDLILQGIRCMQDHRIIEAFLPPDDVSIRALNPCPADPGLLKPHETYVLKAVNHNTRLGDLLAASELGKKESQRVVFILLIMGFAGPFQIKAGRNPLAEAAVPDLDRILAAFNDKCSYIFKYVSKELGPVGLSVLGKSLDEVRPRLGPYFQDAELRGDGRIDIRPAVKPGLNAIQDELRKTLVRSLNEILAAEVLAVKRTLGNNHESSLIRNLEKVGECG